MKHHLITLCLSACLTACLIPSSLCCAEEPPGNLISWHHDIYQAHDASVATGKPMLFVVSASWCGPCKKLKKTTLEDPRMVRYVTAAFVPVHLDFEKDEDIMKILEIEQVPCTIVLSPDADLLGRMVGYAPPLEYFKALEKSRRVQKALQAYQQTSGNRTR